MAQRKKAASEAREARVNKLTVEHILKTDRPDVRTIIRCLELNDRLGHIKHLMTIVVDNDGELHPIGDVSRATQLLLLEMMRERIAAGDLCDSDVDDPVADDLLRQFWISQQLQCENCEFLEEDDEQNEGTEP